MIKKILLTLLVLIILVIIGLVCLVLFVDPNNFRGFISQTVKDKTGYELTIEGDLRWHVWPQISILSGPVRLQDEGATKPILSADNMRLDVALFPLFSKKLSIENVFVKSAVINITDESQGEVAQRKPSAPAADNQGQNQSTAKPANSSWSFSLDKLEIADSTVLLQTNQDMVKFSDINIALYQKTNQHAELDFSGRINRNQRELAYNLNALADLSQYPNQIGLNINKLNYNITGTDIPAGGLTGNITGNFEYQATPRTLRSDDLLLTLNDNQLKTQFIYTETNNKPNITVSMSSPALNLTPFMSSTKQNNTAAPTNSAPVVTASAKGNELAFLNDFDAKLNLQVKALTADKFSAQNLIADLDNKAGLANINQFSLDIGQGKVSATGSANGRLAQAAVALKADIKQIQLGELLSQFDITQNFEGLLNAQGDFKFNTIRPEAILPSLSGDMNIVMSNARLNNMNIQQVIQLAVSQFSKSTVSTAQQQQYTSLQTLSAKGHLVNGNLNLSSLVADSETLDINGAGNVNLVQKDLDMNLNVKVLGGWNGSSQTIAGLQKLVIPFRIYGQFDKLHYQLDVAKLFKDELKDNLQNGLDKLKDRFLNGTNQSNSSSEQPQEAPKESTRDKLNQLLNSIK
ncbi:outer membrane assembly protein AsmA [Utexia brackfieldae]|uniref:outer membrane assembly protein AsmA n=1 Tax=Utexia brackfieldae TaxID=3074108 RepID=UPI00370D0E87